MSTANIGQTPSIATWAPQMPIPGTVVANGASGPPQQDLSSIGSAPPSLGLIPPNAGGPQVDSPAARPGGATPQLPAGTPTQQAQDVVAEAHAIFNKVSSTSAIGEQQAAGLVRVVDAATSQLNAIAQEAGTSDPALTSFINSNLSDLANARTAYAGLAGDVAKDDSTDKQAWQAADQSVLADVTEEDTSETAVVQGDIANGGGDGGDGGS